MFFQIRHEFTTVTIFFKIDKEEKLRAYGFRRLLRDLNL